MMIILYLLRIGSVECKLGDTELNIHALSSSSATRLDSEFLLLLHVLLFAWESANTITLHAGRNGQFLGSNG